MCTTEVVVLKAPAVDGELCCGEVPMLDFKAERAATIRATGTATTLLGKRYGDDISGLELLCTRGGDGALTFDGRALVVRAVKPLPSSD
ncbi:MAG: hypothetical protein NZM12_12815 [Steroidobacteraceae bacterium]|nr:hypothetical protein [Steroidobacteraceae bacterium]